MKLFILRLVLFFNNFSLYYIIVIDCIYFIQLVAAAFNMVSYIKKMKYYNYQRLTNSDTMIPISLLVPAYNEEITIVENIKNLMGLTYPEYEIIVVNDGSKDETLKRIIHEFDMIEIHEPYKQSIPPGSVRQRTE